MAVFAGTAGADTIIGSINPDDIDGLDGDDLIFGYGDGSGVNGPIPPVDGAGGGEHDDDSLDGGDGDDTLRGGGGSDTTHGGDGADRSFGDDGSDRLYGDADADTLHGGLGADTL